MCDGNTPFTTSFHLLSVQTTESLEFKLFHTKLNRARITFTHKSWQLKGSLSSTEESVEVFDGSYWSSLALAPQTSSHKTDRTTQNRPHHTKHRPTPPHNKAQNPPHKAQAHNIGFTMGGFSKSYLERWFQYRLYYRNDNHCIDIHAV